MHMYAHWADTAHWSRAWDKEHDMNKLRLCTHHHRRFDAHEFLIMHVPLRRGGSRFRLIEAANPERSYDIPRRPGAEISRRSVAFRLHCAMHFGQKLPEALRDLEGDGWKTLVQLSLAGSEAE